MDLTSDNGVVIGGRRIISVLFCDVRGSTAAASQLDPEEWAEIMNGAFEQIMQPIYRYEGTVVRLLGDALLAFFGAPIAREDDPQRAVLAALEIQKTVQAYAERVRCQWDVDFQVRCGINTGLVVVGAFGGEQHAEYTAMGDAVNLAARMEQTAQPGTVQISEATYRLVAPLFDVEDLGGIEVKGKDEPQRAYRVLAKRAEPGPLRGIPGLQTPLTGRRTEFATMVSAIERLRRGGGSVIFLLGEAGLGKSRLIRELKQYTSNVYPTTRWYQTGSFSYEKAQPYGQVQHLLRSVCRIAGDDTPAQQREKIAGAVSEMALPDPEQTRRALAVLFGVAEESAAETRLEGETFKGSLFASMIPFWQAIASTYAVVVCFDDMQWMDAASAELLEHVLRNIGEVPLHMLCAMRPSMQSAGWALMEYAESQFGEHVSRIALPPLSQEENEQLLDSLLPAGDTSASVREQILRKAAGNPLFVEEVVRVLRDQAAKAQREEPRAWSTQRELDIEIPDNLQTLLIARVDHLDPEVRETLMLASVLGTSFDFTVLTHVAGRDAAELSEHMHELQLQGLIKETARSPEPMYRFVHILLQETAYRMILRRQRRQYHLRVAETLEELYADNLSDRAVVLAHHFDSAGERERASHYYARAGNAALRLYSLQEAIAHFSRALELLRQQEPEHITEEWTWLYICKGRAFELDTHFDDALDTYNEMEALAQQYQDRHLELAAKVARLPLYAVPTRLFDPELGRTEGEQALVLAREMGDEAAESRLLWSLSNVYALTNRLEIATEYGERSLALAEKLGLRDQIVMTLTDLGVFCYAADGRLNQAQDALQRASEISREINDLPMLGDDLASLALVSVLAGEYEQAIHYSAEAAEVSESIHNLWGQSYSRYKVGMAYWEQGNPDRAIDTIQTCLRLGEEAGFLASKVEPRVDLATIYSCLGAADRALAELDLVMAVPTTRHLPDHAYVLATQTHVLLCTGDREGAQKLMETYRDDHADATWPSYRGPLRIAEAELALAREEFQRAADITGHALNDLRRYGIRSQIPNALLMRGRALTRLGGREAARECLRQAQAEADALGSRWMLWQIQSALADVVDDASEAEALRTQAHAIIDEIVRRLSDPALRRSFLGAPPISALRQSIASP